MGKYYYTYFVLETWATDVSGQWYVYDDDAGKLVTANNPANVPSCIRIDSDGDGVVDTNTNRFNYADFETITKVADAEALYSVETQNDGNIWTISNTVVSDKRGALKVSKALAGLIGAHDQINVDGMRSGTIMASDKKYSFVVIDSDGYRIAVTQTAEDISNTESSGGEIIYYTYDGKESGHENPDYDPNNPDSQQFVTDKTPTVFEFSETQSIQINNLPVAVYTVKELTSDTTVNGVTKTVDLSIEGYTFDDSSTGGSVTSNSVTLESKTDAENSENPDEATLTNSYIPDKGALKITKAVTGLPSGTKTSEYRFPVVITIPGENDTTLYLDAMGNLSTSRYIHYVTDNDPVNIENVPVGTYTVTELTEDDRMPDVTTGADGGVTEETLGRYTLNKNSNNTVTEVTNLKVVKDGQPIANIKNEYSPNGKLVLKKKVDYLGTAYNTRFDLDNAFSDDVPEEKAIKDAILGITFTVTGPNNYSYSVPYESILTANGSYEIEQIPYGTYTVTETNSQIADYRVTTTYIVTGEEENEGSVASNVTIDDDHIEMTVEFLNTYEVNEKSFSIKKVWMDSNTNSANSVTWPQKDEKDRTITVNVYGVKSGTEPVLLNAYSLTSASSIESDEHPYTVELKTETIDGKTYQSYEVTFNKLPPEYDSFYAVESDLDGYAVVYGHTMEEESSLSMITGEGQERATDGQYIFNQLVQVALPSTGGLGIAMYYLLGLTLIAISTVSFFFMRHRKMI